MFFVMIGVIVILAVGIVGVLFYGNSMLKKQSEKLVELKLEEQLLEEQQASILKASQDIEQYADLEEIAETVVPQDKDQARAVREIIRIAGEVGIPISSISFPSSNLGTKQAPVKQPSEDSESSAPSTPPPAPLSQATPAEGISGVYALEMNIVPDPTTQVTYYQFLDFLERLENNRRTAQVTSVRITPSTADSENPIIDFSLTINIFVKP